VNDFSFSVGVVVYFFNVKPAELARFVLINKEALWCIARCCNCLLLYLYTKMLDVQFFCVFDKKE
jgi:hypothetical protein